MERFAYLPDPSQTMITRLSTCCLVILFVGFACVDGYEPGPDQPVSETNENYNERQDEAVEAYCACYTDDEEYDDQEECEEEESEPADLDECEEKAANCDHRNYAKVMECGEEALADYEECVEECPEDSETIEECESDLEEDFVECDEKLSPTLSRALSECAEGAEAPSCDPESEEDASNENPCEDDEVYIQLEDGSQECAARCDDAGDCEQGEDCVPTSDTGTKVCYDSSQM
ncbi:MAG: hypothetical protein ACOCV2_00340 [Persicimonas sp.]